MSPHTHIFTKILFIPNIFEAQHDLKFRRHSMVSFLFINNTIHAFYQKKIIIIIQYMPI